MSRVLLGTAPQDLAHAQVDLTPASAWIEAHYDEFRGQWVAVRLAEPALVAHASTLSQLWQLAPPALLKDSLLHYVCTIEEEHHPQEPWWEG
jgi:hypothetical protein